MAKKSHRAFAFTFALLFLLTSVGGSGLVIYQLIQEDKASKVDSNATAAKESLNMNTSRGKDMPNFTPVAEVTELQKTDLVEGTGAEATAASTVTVHYTGAVASTGKIFESSKDSGEPVSFGLNQVIKGWTDGVPGMKVGGTRRLVIPADQAYGASSPSEDIPANSALVFDIELVSVQ